MSPTGTKRTALITGASAGIGNAFAHEYARRNIDLVLVARRGDRLRSSCDELADAHGISAIALEADLSDPGAPETIYKGLAADAIDVDILVNSAGYGVPGAFMSNTLQTHQDFQQVMVDGVIQLCYLFIPGMRERKSGTIINVASLAGYMPGTPGHTLYGAAKAWMIRFSESLAFELNPEGIHVCALCPGFTYSEFHDVTGTREKVSRIPGYRWMTAEEVARQGVEAAEQGRIVFVNGRVNRSIALLERLLPRRWIYRLVERHAKDFRNME